VIVPKSIGFPVLGSSNIPSGMSEELRLNKPKDIAIRISMIIFILLDHLGSISINGLFFVMVVLIY
jgi:hypothetical protein